MFMFDKKMKGVKMILKKKLCVDRIVNVSLFEQQLPRQLLLLWTLLEKLRVQPTLWGWLKIELTRQTKQS